MTRLIMASWVVLGIGLAVGGAPREPTKAPALRLFLSEVQPGTMSSEHYCLLVFSDRTFHAEKASRKTGKDRDRKVYEGQLSDSDWSALGEILDSKAFRDLDVPPGVPPLVMEDTHPYTISVARGTKFQNMEFLDNKSRKPYDSQLRPLFQWWKSLRGAHMPASEAPADIRCALNRDQAIFSN